MKRVFTESEKKKLISYVTDRDEIISWNKIKDIDDIKYYNLDIDDYIDDIDSFHNKIIDSEDYTENRIEMIFNGVEGVDQMFGAQTKQLCNLMRDIKDDLVKLNAGLNVSECDSPENYLMNDTKSFIERMNKIKVPDCSEIEESYDFVNGIEIEDISFFDKALTLLKNRDMSLDEFVNYKEDLYELEHIYYIYLSELMLGKTSLDPKSWLLEYVPKYVSDKTVIYIMTALSSPLDKEDIIAHYYSNKSEWINEGDIKESDDLVMFGKYIEYQGNMKEYYLGKMVTDYTADYNACEIIALYNAFVSLGDTKIQHDFPELLATFEAKGLAFRGGFGTSPKLLEEYLVEEGYEIKSLSDKHAKDKKEVDLLQNEYKTYIVTFYNNQYDIAGQVHTMSITLETTKKGPKYFFHNGDVHKKAYDSLYDAINGYKGGNSEVINVIGIK